MKQTSEANVLYDDEVYRRPELVKRLVDINDIIPDMEEAIENKVESFIAKSGNQPYEHINEGYTVIVRTTNELDATEAISDYLRKKTELLF